MGFWERLITPLTVKRVKVTNGYAYHGYLRVYIFGLRIANVQLTNPWS